MTTICMSTTTMSRAPRGSAISWTFSGVSAGATDFIVGHYLGAPLDIYPSATLFHSGAGAPFSIEATDAVGMNAMETGEFLDQLLGQNRLADVYEAYLTAGISYDFQVTRKSGSSDLMFAVVTDFADVAYSRGQGMAEGNPTTPDEDVLTHFAQTTAWHPVLVVRPNGADLDPVTYDFTFEPTPASAVNEDEPTPRMLRLTGAYPNPLRSSSRLVFELPQETFVALQVFDVMGRRIRTLTEASYPTGLHEVTWDGRDEQGIRVSAGSYFAKLDAGGETRSVALLVVR